MFNYSNNSIPLQICYRSERARRQKINDNLAIINTSVTTNGFPVLLLVNLYKGIVTYVQDMKVSTTSLKNCATTISNHAIICNYSFSTSKQTFFHYFRQINPMRDAVALSAV